MKYLIYKGLLPILILYFPVYAAFSAQLTPEQALGKQLFYDARLSQPAGQACGQCHAPTHGFSDPRGITAPVSEGVHKGRFTSRNAPTVAYLATAPDFHFDKKEGLYIGGFFLDGRSQKLEQQVLGPLLSPLEMANPNRQALAQRLRDAGYEKKLEKLYGENALADTDKTLASLGKALAAWIRGPELNAFTSKYDFYLAGKAQLTEQEKRGLKLFEDEKKVTVPPATRASRKPASHRYSPISAMTIWVCLPTAKTRFIHRTGNIILQAVVLLIWAWARR